MNPWTSKPLNVLTPKGLLKNVTITVHQGRITAITPCASPATDVLDTAVPAFVDLHIHGMGGYGPEQGTAQSLWQMSETLAQQGVAAFCPTLYGAHPEKMIAQLRALTEALGKETGAHILGFHLEGPFLSPHKLGVMRPEDLVPASLDDFKKIYEAAQGKISILTLAPELPGIDPIIEFCARHHILVQAGHTNATYEQMQEAVVKGIRRVTHWGNAMSGLHQRSPGVLGAALLNPNISCEVIADGKHVHPALLTLLREIKPIHQITAVTDALLPTGQAEGPFRANSELVTLREGVWKRSKDGVTAGSALTMGQALQQLFQAGFTLQESCACTSTNAANLLGFSGGRLEVGAPACWVLVDEKAHVKEKVFK